MMGDTICARCGNPAEGFAYVGNDRFCHPDDPEKPDCYHLVTVYKDTTRVDGHRMAELDVIEAAEEMVLLLDQHEAARTKGRTERWDSSKRLNECRQKMKAAVLRMYES